MFIFLASFAYKSASLIKCLQLENLKNRSDNGNRYLRLKLHIRLRYWFFPLLSIKRCFLRFIDWVGRIDIQSEASVSTTWHFCVNCKENSSLTIQFFFKKRKIQLRNRNGVGRWRTWLSDEMSQCLEQLRTGRRRRIGRRAKCGSGGRDTRSCTGAKGHRLRVSRRMGRRMRLRIPQEHATRSNQ